MMLFANNRLLPIGRDTIDNSIRDNAARGRENLKNILKEVESVCITCDPWTSNANDPYLGVTVHWFGEDDQLHEHLLEFQIQPFPHTAENLREAMYSIFERWEIKNKVLVITADGAMKSVFDIKDDSHVLKLCKQWLWCNGHIINLIVQHALKSNFRLIDKVRNLVSAIRSSPKLSQALDEARRKRGFAPLQPINDTKTRWNSTLDLIERIILLDTDIHQMHLDLLSNKEQVKSVKTLEDKILSPIEVNTLKQHVQLLLPFKKATEAVSVSSYITASTFYPTMLSLRSFLTHFDASNLIKRRVRKAI